MKVAKLIQEHTDQFFIDKFTTLYGLKHFLSKCIISKEYDFKNLDCTKIVLSKNGLEIFSQLKKGKFSSLNDNLLKLGIFIAFYDSELLIDIIESDYQLLSNSISNDVINGKILFPWIYGRTLYDKYYDEFEEQEKTLQNEKVIKLLNNTPKGVFQMGYQVIGPLGILHSVIKRIIPPTTNVNLWHCSDPICTSFHNVSLESAYTIISEVLAEIYTLTEDKEKSEWNSFYRKKCEDSESYYDDKKIDDIPITLVYSFGENELKNILKELIDNKTGSRELLPKGRQFQGSSAKIIGSLSKAECFQIILLFDSIDILVFTEKLISEKKIHIPSTEIRSSKIVKSGGFFRIFHECNELGFRSVSPSTQLSFINLRNLLLYLYEDPNFKHQLIWNLRPFKNESLKEKVEEYINTIEPRQIIRKNVLSGENQVKKTFDILKGYYEMPITPEEDERIIDKILWKLGFNINIYPPFMATFDERLSKFSEIINNTNIYSKSAQEDIRSVAVNLFVSLEEILKHTLAFSTWLLLSDHFRETRFRYNYTSATIFMTKVLHGYKLNDETELEFDSKGRNTLYPLIEGFTALFGICDSYLNEGEGKYKRNEIEFPNFIGKTNLIDFPLNHKMLVFDIKNSSYLNIKEIGLRIPSDFTKFKVLSVRNSLEHDREDFPLKADLILVCECLSKSFENLKSTGLFPNVYLFQSSLKDKHKRILKTFEDYKGRQITIPEIINFKGYPVPSADLPIVIVPSINFPETTEPLRVKYEENSEYLFYWQNFPRKKPKQNST